MPAAVPLTALMIGRSLSRMAGNRVYWPSSIMRRGSPITRSGMSRAAEDAAVFRDIELARATGGRLHVAHVSTKGAVEIIRRAKAEGVHVTAEIQADRHNRQG